MPKGKKDGNRKKIWIKFDRKKKLMEDEFEKV
jgi:hypothetical protein